MPSFGAGSFYFSEKGGLCRAFSTPKSPGRFTSGLKRHRCAVPETGGGFGRDGMKGYRCAVRGNPRRGFPHAITVHRTVMAPLPAFFLMLQTLGRRPNPRTLLKKRDQNSSVSNFFIFKFNFLNLIFCNFLLQSQKLPVLKAGGFFRLFRV